MRIYFYKLYDFRNMNLWYFVKFHIIPQMWKEMFIKKFISVYYKYPVLFILSTLRKEFSTFEISTLKLIYKLSARSYCVPYYSRMHPLRRIFRMVQFLYANFFIPIVLASSSAECGGSNVHVGTPRYHVMSMRTYSWSDCACTLKL